MTEVGEAVNVACWHQAAKCEPRTRTSLRPSHGVRRELKTGHTQAAGQALPDETTSAAFRPVTTPIAAAKLRRSPPTPAPPLSFGHHRPMFNVHSLTPPPALAWRCLGHGTASRPARLRPGQATVGHDGGAREDAGNTVTQAGWALNSTNTSLVDSDVDSYGISPCGSVRAPVSQQGISHLRRLPCQQTGGSAVLPAVSPGHRRP
jgi:hypothetical protein